LNLVLTPTVGNDDTSKSSDDTSSDSDNTNKPVNATEYISTWQNTAIDQMEQYGIPASITLAQAALESAWGSSYLATSGNNHFGIKCHNWSGDTITADDDKKGECFRKYKSADESFTDHSKFIKDNKRYSSLFSLDRTDYKAWAYGLQKAGYATGAGYASKLISIIEKYNLNDLDSGGIKLASLISKPGKKGSLTVTSPFGVDRGDHIHAGTDYRASVGTSITANMGGVVLRAGNWNPTGWGNCVEIKHDDGTITRYAHLSSINVTAGDNIEAGTIIGKTGGDGRKGSGNSKQPHLHWEYMPTDETQKDGAGVASRYFSLV
jgi:murein DD-endopeptidase MepM/ murein hydrolase activator NlpD